MKIALAFMVCAAMSVALLFGLVIWIAVVLGEA